VRPASSSAARRSAAGRREVRRPTAPPVHVLMAAHHRPRATRVRIPYAPSYAAWLRGNRMVGGSCVPDMPQMDAACVHGCVHGNGRLCLKGFTRADVARQWPPLPAEAPRRRRRSAARAEALAVVEDYGNLDDRPCAPIPEKLHLDAVRERGDPQIILQESDVLHGRPVERCPKPCQGLERA
jgi:hypothetical protein